MKDKKIFDELNQTMLLMCKQSPFAFFYFQLVQREITNRIQIEMKMGLDGSMHDLSLTELDKIKRYKERQQKHQKTGFLNQSDLIKELQSYQTLQNLNKAGILLKKIGTTKLKKILSELKSNAAIPFHKEKTAVFYRKEDLKDIALKIAEMI